MTITEIKERISKVIRRGDMRTTFGLDLQDVLYGILEYIDDNSLGLSSEFGGEVVGKYDNLILKRLSSFLAYNNYVIIQTDISYNVITHGICYISAVRAEASTDALVFPVSCMLNFNTDDFGISPTDNIRSAFMTNFGSSIFESGTIIAETDGNITICLKKKSDSSNANWVIYPEVLEISNKANVSPRSAIKAVYQSANIPPIFEGKELNIRFQTNLGFLVTNSGLGDKFLSDDGTYKQLQTDLYQAYKGIGGVIDSFDGFVAKLKEIMDK